MFVKFEEWLLGSGVVVVSYKYIKHGCMMARVFDCNSNGGQFIPRRCCRAVLIRVSDTEEDIYNFFKFHSRSRVVVYGSNWAPKY